MVKFSTVTVSFDATARAARRVETERVEKRILRFVLDEVVGLGRCLLVVLRRR